MSAAATAKAGLVESARGEMLRWAGLVLLLAPMIARASTSNTILPAWDLDPTIYSLPTPAIGPAGSILADAISLLGAAALLVAEWRSGRRLLGWTLWLAGLGSLACVAHAWFLPHPDCRVLAGSIGNQRLGAAWMSAIWGGVAAAHAARDVRFRTAAIGVLLGFLALLCLRGLQQVFIDHAETLRAYRADPERFLASRGWNADSPMARSFVRRISQPEATGWFGLSNAYASFAAFGVVVSCGLCMAAWNRGRDGPGSARPTAAWLGGIVALAVSTAALWASQSKGGVGAALLGLGLLAVAPLLSRGRVARHGPVFGIAVPLAVLAAIAARGLVGERLGELSILFRAFYIEAAVRIFGSHPWTGVGPDAFQQAYLIAKNPLSPEEVSSPHSILFDWLATLGVAGAAWGVLMFATAAGAGRRLTESTPEAVSESGQAIARTTDRSRAAKAAMLTLALATIVATWMESPYITVDLAAIRLGALGFGCLIVWCIVSDRAGVWTRRALAGGSLAILAHAQLEVTLSLALAAGPAMIAIGLGIGGFASIDSVRGQRCLAWKPMLAAGSVCAAAISLLAFAALPALRWQRTLETAARPARVVAHIAELAGALASPPSASSDAHRLQEELIAILNRELGRPVDPRAGGMERAMIAVERRRLGEAAAGLQQAIALEPAEWRVAREAGRLHLRIAFGYLAENERARADAAAREAEGVMSPPAPPTPTNAGSSMTPVVSAPWLRALAVVQETYGRRVSDAAWLSRAAQTLGEAANLDPHNLDVALRLFRLHTMLGDRDAARRWAKRCLQLDHEARLDAQVRGLTPDERREVEAGAGGS